MRICELRKAFAEAKLKGAWETCAGLTESVAVQSTSKIESVVMHLYAAESLALLAGMPGLSANRLYGATEADPIDPLLWEAFCESTLNVRNIALYGYALRSRMTNAKTPFLKARYSLLFAHYLRMMVSEHGDAVQMYVEAANLHPDFVVTALVALHQLYRDDPLCIAANNEIQKLCQKNGVSEADYDSLQESLSSLDEEAKEEIASAKIKLARMALMLWGNISHGIQWLSSAVDLSERVAKPAAAIIKAVGLAMPENQAVLAHCSDLLEKIGDWEGALEIEKMLLKLDASPKERVHLTMKMAYAAAHIEHADNHVAHYMLLAAHSDPKEWWRIVEREPWILRFAEQVPIFGATMLELLSQTGAKKAYSDLRDLLNGSSLAINTTNDEMNPSENSTGKFNSSKIPSTRLNSGRLTSARQGSGKLASGKIDMAEKSGLGLLNNRDDEGCGMDVTYSVAELLQVWEADPEQSWKCIIEAVLQYVPYSLSWSARCPEGYHVLLASLKGPDQAYEILNEALNEMIGNSGFFQQVLKMSDNQDRQRVYMEKLDAAIMLYAHQLDRKNALLAQKYRIAEILGDDRLKLICLKDIIESDPSDFFAIRHVESLDEANLKPHAQILLCQLQMYITRDEATRHAKKVHMAELYTRSSQYNNAINLYHLLIEEAPKALEPRYQLLELLVRLENWKSAENVLLSILALEKDEHKRFDAFIRLADIQDTKMMVPSRALLTLFAALNSKEDIQRLHVKLCSISERLNTYSPLIDKYEDLASHGNNIALRGQATLMLARLYINQVGKPGIASKILNDFFESDGYFDLEFIREMEGLCEEMRLWKDYVRVLLRIVEISTDKKEIIRATLNAAQVYAANIGDYAQAIVLVRRAAEMQPDNADEWIEIAQVLAMRDEYNDALFALQHALAYQQGTEKAQTLLMIAQIYGSCDDIGEATRMFHQAVRLKPGIEALTPVAEALITLATTRHNQSAFDIICADLVSTCSEAEQSQMMLQQALTLARVFDDMDGAAAIIRKLEPHLPEFDFSQCCMFADILALLHKDREALELNYSILKSENLQDQQRFERLQVMLNSATRLQDVALVKEICAAILEIDAEDTSANFQLIQLDYTTGHWDAAATRIQAFLPFTERLSAESAVLLHYYYADILHAAEHDDLALESLDLALSIRADYRPAVELKLVILLDNERWRDTLPSFEILLNLSHDPEEKGAIHKRIAEVWHFYLGNYDRAIIEYELALTLGGDVEDVPIRLLELYRYTQAWQKAAVMAEVLAEAQVSSEDARLEYLQILGDIQERHLGNLALASKTYFEMFSISPLSELVVLPFVRVLVRTQDIHNLQYVAESLVGKAKRDFDAATRMLEILFNHAGASTALRPVLKSVLDMMDARFEGRSALARLHVIYNNPPMLPDDSDVNLSNLDLVKNAPTKEASKEAGTRQRKRTITSPRGSLTLDSGLLNANFDSNVFIRPTIDSGLIRVPRIESKPIGRPVISDSSLQHRPITDSYRPARDDAMPPPGTRERVSTITVTQLSLDEEEGDQFSDWPLLDGKDVLTELVPGPATQSQSTIVDGMDDLLDEVDFNSLVLGSLDDSSKKL